MKTKAMVMCLLLALSGCAESEGADSASGAEAPLTSGSATDTRTTSAAALARSFISAFEREDFDAMNALITDDIVLDEAFPPPTIPPMLTGRPLVNAFIRRVGELMRVIRFVNPSFQETANGQIAYFEATGDFVTERDTPYRNRYIMRFDVRDGKIVRIVEYLNPLIVIEQLGSGPPQ
jgi:ketosteroid isomerase-like protein